MEPTVNRLMFGFPTYNTTSHFARWHLFLVRSQVRHPALISRRSASCLLLSAIFISKPLRVHLRNENMNRFLSLTLAKAPLSLAIMVCSAGSALPAPMPGSLPAQWNAGAENCAASPQPPLQVHAYEPQTFILRQSPCLNPEANFLYLLIGSQKALLVDTGAVPDPKKVPLGQTVLSFCRPRMGYAFHCLSRTPTNTAIITLATGNSPRCKM